jgi:hypothetical protein
MAKHIKILKHFNAYNPGEVALFDDDAAAQIVERKFGVEVKLGKDGTPVDNAADQK